MKASQNHPRADRIDPASDLTEGLEDDSATASGAAANPTTFVADLIWVYLHLDHPRVQRVNAGSAARRWSLLLWGRDERTRFYKLLVTRALTAKVGPTPPDSQREAEAAPLDINAELDKLRDEILSEGVPQEVCVDAQGLVAEWAHECRIDASTESLRLLSRYVASAVVRSAHIARRANL